MQDYIQLSFTSNNVKYISFIVVYIIIIIKKYTITLLATFEIYICFFTFTK